MVTAGSERFRKQAGRRVGGSGNKAFTLPASQATISPVVCRKESCSEKSLQDPFAGAVGVKADCQQKYS